MKRSTTIGIYLLGAMCCTGSICFGLASHETVTVAAGAVGVAAGLLGAVLHLE